MINKHYIFSLWFYQQKRRHGLSRLSSPSFHFTDVSVSADIHIYMSQSMAELFGQFSFNEMMQAEVARSESSMNLKCFGLSSFQKGGLC